MRVFINNQMQTNLLNGTVSISTRANGERSLSVSFYETLQNFLREGDEIEVFEGTVGTTKLFGGIINGVSTQFLSPLTDDTPLIQIDVNSDGYGIIPQRRVVSVSYTNTNIRTIVLAMLSSSNLGAETVFVGTIAPESQFESINYSAQFKTIAEVLDELAQASGCIWYIDNSRRLHFIPQPGIVNAPFALNTYNGTFFDFHELSWSSSMDNYCNKVFVVGDNTSVAIESESEIAERATEAEGQGTGVYGFVIEDSNVKSQFQGTVVANAHLRNYAVRPIKLSFSTYTKGFQPGQRLQLQIVQMTGFNPIPPNLPNIWYFLIEEVSMERESATVTKYSISATRRNNGNFSTQKSAGFKDYFKQLVKKG
jgi:hypothetical protein